MDDPIFLAGRIVGLSLSRIPDSEEFVLKVVSEVKFPDREPLFSQMFFDLSQYELDAFLESVAQVTGRPAGDQD